MRWLLIGMTLVLFGCGSSDKPTAAPAPQVAATPQPTRQPIVEEKPAKPTEPVRRATMEPAKKDDDGSIAVLNQFMNDDGAGDRFRPAPIEPRVEFEIDPATLAANGLRQIKGKHLTLITDLPTSPEVDELPTVFDAAFPLWCEYFNVDPVKFANWHTKGCLMSREEPFVAAGMLPNDLPKFLHGYARGDAFWLREQPSPQYRRHLLLHEGTHSFMERMFGGGGPPWYSEGIAEYFGTHYWRDGKLTIGVVPASKEEMPMWGRIKIIKEDFAARQGKTLDDVMNYALDAHLQTSPYGWCWGAVTYLETDPRTHDEFRKLQEYVRLGYDMNRRFQESLADQWPEINEGWQMFVANADYGYDFTRNRIAYAPGKPIAGDTATAVIQTNQGWQSTGILLEAGKTYEIAARGRYLLQQNPDWPCEPNGVTLHYFNERPLGQLLCGLRPDDWKGPGASPLTISETVGTQRTLTPPLTATLYMKVNDNPGQLADNVGEIEIAVREKAQ
ncbi:hypothetical protein LOC68_17055 [Blastopirellula sp. JC732]|uniref:DUF1570 domain-containing protein n=1 Tax=Blastopirellula sediminis TaxID=2894196 RepID=A0A9X1SKS7_9BACT|nr:hypothetical protein [Blastopirellula sediminis]MCC9606599.1 hypothetical protein [Blastopirellula sediminis]MCC9630104.1 hypothetical protein [Blastopirellula sediminis]